MDAAKTQDVFVEVRVGQDTKYIARIDSEQDIELLCVFLRFVMVRQCKGDE